MGLPTRLSGKQAACQCKRRRRGGFNLWVEKIPWRGKWQPTPVFLPGKFHGQRILAGYSPWGRKESDMTESTHTHTHTHAHTVFKTYCVPATFTRYLAISTFKHLLLRNIPLKVQQQCTYELITNYHQRQPQRRRNALNRKAMVWRQPWLGLLSRALLGE